MSKTAGRQVNIGMGIEATAGTAVAETIFLPWTGFSVQAVAEKALFNSVRGVRNMASNSMIRRKYSQGSITVIPNVVNAPYFFGLALGTVATALAETPSSTGNATSASASKLIDSGADFVTDTVAIGDAVHNTTDGTFALVTAVDNLTTLSLDADIFPLGSEAYQVATPVYTHTITLQEANASMKTATVTVEEGAIQTVQYTNIVADTLTVEASDGYASMTMEVIGQFATTDTIVESYTEETEFAYHNMTVKFGTTVANAVAGSATPLKSLSLNIGNNVQLDEAFLSGANTITSGGLVAGPLQVTGTYVLHFENTTELAKYKADTKNAAVIQFIGAAIGDTDAEELRIDLAKLILTDPPVEYDVDGLLVLTQNFEVQYDATDLSIKAIITNELDGTSY